MKLVLGKDFPAAPPKGFFLTKIFHPNVGPSGEICVNVLKRDWRAELGLRHVPPDHQMPADPAQPRVGAERGGGAAAARGLRALRRPRAPAHRHPRARPPARSPLPKPRRPPPGALGRRPRAPRRPRAQEARGGQEGAPQEKGGQETRPAPALSAARPQTQLGTGAERAQAECGGSQTQFGGVPESQPPAQTQCGGPTPPPDPFWEPQPPQTHFGGSPKPPDPFWGSQSTPRSILGASKPL
uniref:Ubiquitin conjugating enzyme E2 S n=1 Tax=Junco hyemalis TaxID=40217 RepID=A0A8C5JJ19_JUNHY